MKIRIMGDYGFAGTEFDYTEDISEDVVEGDNIAIDEYIAEQEIALWDDMCGNLSLSITLLHEL